MNELPIGWNNLTIIPPENYVEVIDADGNTAFALPTYYPFEITHKDGDDLKPWGWRGTIVHYEDGISRWDGRWLVSIGMNIDKIGNVIGWKLIDTNIKEF